MIEKNVILAVSFGTSYDDSREKTIGAVERAVAEAYPDYEVRRAFTSRMILRKLRERGLLFSDVEEALERAVKDSVNTLVVLPTHLMGGYEYTKLAGIVKGWKDRFKRLALAGPLLMEEDDFAPVAAALKKEISPYMDGRTAFCYMGHGTESASNRVYERLQEELLGLGCEECYIGTVEAEPTLDAVLWQMREKKAYQRVVVKPLMLVAGDHANQDMAGEGEDSWKSRLEAEGYQVHCILRGLGENPEIQKLYVERAERAIQELNLLTGKKGNGISGKNKREKEEGVEE